MGASSGFRAPLASPGRTSVRERAVTETEIADALLAARDACREAVPPTIADAEFGLDAAYRVGAALDIRLRERGYRRAGCKVGFTNKAIWPRFGLKEPILAPVYDRTLHAAEPSAEVSLRRFHAPRIEVEVVFGLDRGPDAGPDASPDAGPDASLDANPDAGPGLLEGRGAERLAWVALGFEIVDCHYPDWHLTPADSVADFGLHGALVVGPRIDRAAARFGARVDGLDRLEVRLLRDERVVARGRGRDVLGHPRAALACVPRLLPRFGAAGISAVGPPAAAPPAATNLPAGGLVSTGTMTPLAPLAPGERWRVEADGVDLPSLKLVLTD